MRFLTVLLLLFVTIDESVSYNIKNVRNMIKTIIISTGISLSPIILCQEQVHAATTTTIATTGTTLDAQLKAMQDAQNALDSADLPYIEIPGSKVTYREFRSGKDKNINQHIQSGSIVTASLTVRMKSFPTAKEPGGIKYYDTAVDTKEKQLTWIVGSGQYLPELELAMLADGGMNKGAIRRIEVPSTSVFKARNNKQLPLPAESNQDGNRRYKNLFKTDATLLFEVLLKSVVNPGSVSSSAK